MNTNVLFHKNHVDRILSCAEVDDEIREVLGYPKNSRGWLEGWKIKANEWGIDKHGISNMTHLIAPKHSPLRRVLDTISNQYIEEIGTHVPTGGFLFLIDKSLREHLNLPTDFKQMRHDGCYRKWNLRFGRVLLEGDDKNLILTSNDYPIIDFLHKNLYLNEDGIFSLWPEP